MGGTEPFRLKRHTIVTPQLLDYLAVEASIPQVSGAIDQVSQSDTEEIHERINDLG